MTQQQTHDFSFKVVLVGNQGVGKTTFLIRFATGEFRPEVAPNSNIDFKIKTLERREKRVKLTIWDTAGQERYRSMTASYYKGARGCLLMYDITDETSFRNMQAWHQEMIKHSPEHVKAILVGTKSHATDSREVPTEQGLSLAQELDIPFIEVSSEENSNVHQCFEILLDNILEDLDQRSKIQTYTPMALKETPETKKPTKCCW